MIREMTERAGIELVNFEASGSTEIDAGDYRLYVANPVLEADVIINLPKLKTHTLTLMTGAVKNMFGTVPGFRKAEMHKIFPGHREFAAMIVELFSHVRPALNIMDAVLAMEGNGPSSGSPRELGLVAVSDDAVALDAVMAGVSASFLTPLTDVIAISLRAPGKYTFMDYLRLNLPPVVFMGVMVVLLPPLIWPFG